MKRFFAVATVIIATITLLGCFGKKQDPQTPTQQLTTIIYSGESQTPVEEQTQSAEAQQMPNEEASADVITDVISDTAPQLEPDTIPAPSVADESTTMGKTGEMAFSDDPNNRYISAVATKYSLDSSTLVALYTVPENDANIVLEFDGSKDSNGKLIRTDKTLVAIYSIDKALNSQCASKDSKKNEYPYGEMMVMFMTTTKYIMPEFEGQF